MAGTDFWNDQEKAQKVIDENNHLKGMVQGVKELEEAQEEVEEIFPHSRCQPVTKWSLPVLSP